MSNAIPSIYNQIKKVEVTLEDGSIYCLTDERAKRWAEAVDWGIRSEYMRQIQKHNEVIENFNWDIRRKDE